MSFFFLLFSCSFPPGLNKSCDNELRLLVTLITPGCRVEHLCHTAFDTNPGTPNFKVSSGKTDLGENGKGWRRREVEVEIEGGGWNKSRSSNFVFLPVTPHSPSPSRFSQSLHAAELLLVGLSQLAPGLQEVHPGVECPALSPGRVRAMRSLVLSRSGDLQGLSGAGEDHRSVVGAEHCLTPLPMDSVGRGGALG